MNKADFFGTKTKQNISAVINILYFQNDSTSKA